MISVPSRRGLAALAAAATLGAGFVTPVVSAAAALPAPTQRGLLDPVQTLLGLLTSALTPAQVQGLLTTLGLDTPAELGDLLAAANPSQLAILLDSLTPAQLDGALGSLLPAELLAVLQNAS